MDYIIDDEWVRSSTGLVMKSIHNKSGYKSKFMILYFGRDKYLIWFPVLPSCNLHSIYVNMFGNELEFHCEYEAKNRVDLFLDKFRKLKCFL